MVVRSLSLWERVGVRDEMAQFFDLIFLILPILAFDFVSV